MKAVLYQPVTDLRSSVCYKLYQIICTWTPHLLIRAYSHFRIQFALLFWEKSNRRWCHHIWDFLIWPWPLMCINYMISLVRYKSISTWCYNELFVRKNNIYIINTQVLSTSVGQHVRYISVHECVVASSS